MIGEKTKLESLSSYNSKPNPNAETGTVYIEDSLEEEYRISAIPKPANLELFLGDIESPVLTFQIRAKKSLSNRFKYWMLCEFFPFKIRKWTKIE